MLSDREGEPREPPSSAATALDGPFESDKHSVEGQRLRGGRVSGEESTDLAGVSNFTNTVR